MEKAKTQTIDHKTLGELVDRVENAIENDLALTVDDMKLLLCAITTLCTLQSKMEDNNITLHKLRKLLGMVQQSERRRSEAGKGGSKGKGKVKKKKKKSKKPKNKNSEPTVVHHKMDLHHRGEVCTACHKGKLYKYSPGQLLRITGHTRYQATRHIFEQMRCNACQAIYKAELPEHVLSDGDVNQKYGYSARTMMVIDKFYMGTPYYHQENLSDLFGESITASTIYDQCEYAANDAFPIYKALKKLAANAYRFSFDDTRNRILDQEPEYRDKPNGKGKQLRKGIFTSAVIAELESGHDIILYKTNLGHAGEFLSEILEKRDAKQPAPLTMCDALMSNLVTKVEVKSAYCNAHARRHFYDLQAIYPKDIDWLLETYGGIWENESKTKTDSFSDVERLCYHKKHSLPLMRKIKEWAEKRKASRAFEEHSALGKAVKYFLKYYDNLKLFCAEPGALIDNNRTEEKLKTPIRGRKTAHFYKTTIGADVSNVLTSLIATTNAADENVFHYFQAIQKNREKVKQNPQDWLPWVYRETLEKLNESSEISPNDSS